MARKDIISKQLIKRIAVDLAVYLLKLDIRSEDLELLPTEQQRVEDRRADLVAKVKQAGGNFILHIEIQNNNDATMPLRMLRYYTDIKFAHPKLPIRQYVIYIGSAKLTMADVLSDAGLNYRYTLINMHSIDYQELLKQDTPDAIVLAVLGDFKHDSKVVAVREIILKLQQKLVEHPEQFGKYFYMLESLSENRGLKAYINEVKDVLTQINVENFASYQWGMEKGMAVIVEQLLKTLSPEQVATLTNMPVDKIKEIKQSIKPVNEQKK